MIFVALSILSLLAQDPVAGILAGMDKNAAHFSSAKANVQYTAHNAAVDVETVSSGTIAIKGTSTAFIDITKPSPRQISVGKGMAQIYTPKLQLVDEYVMTGKFSTLFQQFSLLGFGSSGTDLKNAYSINFVGNESVAGVKTTHLQLIPKSPEVAKDFTKVEMWLNEATGYPAQLRFTTPAGDTNTVLYSNLKVNPKLSDSDLQLKVPSGVKRRRVN